MSEKINVMVIPFQYDCSVVLPRNLVEYVLPYATPLPSSYTHQALVGSLIYQNEKVPVVDLSVLYNNNPAMLTIDGNRRIVIISCITEHPEFSSYAVIASDAPRLLALEADEMKEDEQQDLPEYFYSRIHLGHRSQKVYVPDLAVLEQQLFSEILR